jgi:glycosyltransferase involved in cell wall biosynthesis
MGILARKNLNATLVITGQNTETIHGYGCDTGMILDREKQNIVGLGYVSTRDMNALISGASAVVTSSLYEAGNGPGLDGWIRGIPVAMSNIPAFVEHIRIQDVRAQVFDPRSPEDIALKLEYILNNPSETAQDTRHSRNALSNLTWTKVAQNYRTVFEETVKGASTHV